MASYEISKHNANSVVFTQLSELKDIKWNAKHCFKSSITLPHAQQNEVEIKSRLSQRRRWE